MALATLLDLFVRPFAELAPAESSLTRLPTWSACTTVAKDQLASQRRIQSHLPAVVEPTFNLLFSFLA